MGDTDHESWGWFRTLRAHLKQNNDTTRHSPNMNRTSTGDDRETALTISIDFRTTSHISSHPSPVVKRNAINPGKLFPNPNAWVIDVLGYTAFACPSTWSWKWPHIDTVAVVTPKLPWREKNCEQNPNPHKGVQNNRCVHVEQYTTLSQGEALVGTCIIGTAALILRELSPLLLRQWSHIYYVCILMIFIPSSDGA